MKFPKILVVSVVLSILAGILTGCGCEHEYMAEITKEATCVEEGVLTYTCVLCGNTYTESVSEPDAHKYSSEITKEATVSETGVKTYTCSLCGDSYTEIIDKLKGNWEIGYYVDDFGDKTNDSYVIGTFTGTFSNSATSGSRLTVYVYLDPVYPSITQIRLLEYGSSKATFLSSERQP